MCGIRHSAFRKPFRLNEGFTLLENTSYCLGPGMQSGGEGARASHSSVCYGQPVRGDQEETDLVKETGVEGELQPQGQNMPSEKSPGLGERGMSPPPQPAPTSTIAVRRGSLEVQTEPSMTLNSLLTSLATDVWDDDEEPPEQTLEQILQERQSKGRDPLIDAQSAAAAAPINSGAEVDPEDAEELNISDISGGSHLLPSDTDDSFIAPDAPLVEGQPLERCLSSGTPTAVALERSVRSLRRGSLGKAGTPDELSEHTRSFHLPLDMPSGTGQVTKSDGSQAPHDHMCLEAVKADSDERAQPVPTTDVPSAEEDSSGVNRALAEVSDDQSQASLQNGGDGPDGLEYMELLSSPHIGEEPRGYFSGGELRTRRSFGVNMGDVSDIGTEECGLAWSDKSNSIQMSETDFDEQIASWAKDTSPAASALSVEHNAIPHDVVHTSTVVAPAATQPEADQTPEQLPLKSFVTMEVDIDEHGTVVTLHMESTEIHTTSSLTKLVIAATEMQHKIEMDITQTVVIEVLFPECQGDQGQDHALVASNQALATGVSAKQLASADFIVATFIVCDVVSVAVAVQGRDIFEVRVKSDDVITWGTVNAWVRSQIILSDDECVVILCNDLGTMNQGETAARLSAKGPIRVKRQRFLTYMTVTVAAPRGVQYDTHRVGPTNPDTKIGWVLAKLRADRNRGGSLGIMMMGSAHSGRKLDPDQSLAHYGLHLPTDVGINPRDGSQKYEQRLTLTVMYPQQKTQPPASAPLLSKGSGDAAAGERAAAAPEPCQVRECVAVALYYEDDNLGPMLWGFLRTDNTQNERLSWPGGTYDSGRDADLLDTAVRTMYTQTTLRIARTRFDIMKITADEQMLIDASPDNPGTVRFTLYAVELEQSEIPDVRAAISDNGCEKHKRMTAVGVRRELSGGTGTNPRPGEIFRSHDYLFTLMWMQERGRQTGEPWWSTPQVMQVMVGVLPTPVYAEGGTPTQSNAKILNYQVRNRGDTAAANDNNKQLRKQLSKLHDRVQQTDTLLATALQVQEQQAIELTFAKRSVAEDPAYRQRCAELAERTEQLQAKDQALRVARAEVKNVQGSLAGAEHALDVVQAKLAETEAKLNECKVRCKRGWDTVKEEKQRGQQTIKQWQSKMSLLKNKMQKLGPKVVERLEQQVQGLRNEMQERAEASAPSELQRQQFVDEQIKVATGKLRESSQRVDKTCTRLRAQLAKSKQQHSTDNAAASKTTGLLKQRVAELGQHVKLLRERASTDAIVDLNAFAGHSKSTSAIPNGVRVGQVTDSFPGSPGYTVPLPPARGDESPDGGMTVAKSEAALAALGLEMAILKRTIREEQMDRNEKNEQYDEADIEHEASWQARLDACTRRCEEFEQIYREKIVEQTAERKVLKQRCAGLQTGLRETGAANAELLRRRAADMATMAEYERRITVCEEAKRCAELAHAGAVTGNVEEDALSVQSSLADIAASLADQAPLGDNQRQIMHLATIVERLAAPAVTEGTSYMDSWQAHEEELTAVKLELHEAQTRLATAEQLVHRKETQRSQYAEHSDKRVQLAERRVQQAENGATRARTSLTRSMAAAEDYRAQSEAAREDDGQRLSETQAQLQTSIEELATMRAALSRTRGDLRYSPSAFMDVRAARNCDAEVASATGDEFSSMTTTPQLQELQRQLNQSMEEAQASTRLQLEQAAAAHESQILENDAAHESQLEETTAAHELQMEDAMQTLVGLRQTHDDAHADLSRTIELQKQQLLEAQASPEGEPKTVHEIQDEAGRARVNAKYHKVTRQLETILEEHVRHLRAIEHTRRVIASVQKTVGGDIQHMSEEDAVQHTLHGDLVGDAQVVGNLAMLREQLATAEKASKAMTANMLMVISEEYKIGGSKGESKESKPMQSIAELPSLPTKLAGDRNIALAAALESMILKWMTACTEEMLELIPFLHMIISTFMPRGTKDRPFDMSEHGELMAPYPLMYEAICVKSARLELILESMNLQLIRSTKYVHKWGYDADDTYEIVAPKQCGIMSLAWILAKHRVFTERGQTKLTNLLNQTSPWFARGELVDAVKRFRELMRVCEAHRVRISWSLVVKPIVAVLRGRDKELLQSMDPWTSWAHAREQAAPICKLDNVTCTKDHCASCIPALMEAILSADSQLIKPVSIYTGAEVLVAEELMNVCMRACSHLMTETSIVEEHAAFAVQTLPYVAPTGAAKQGGKQAKTWRWHSNVKTTQPVPCESNGWKLDRTQLSPEHRHKCYRVMDLKPPDGAGIMTFETCTGVFHLGTPASRRSAMQGNAQIPWVSRTQCNAHYQGKMCENRVGSKYKGSVVPLCFSCSARGSAAGEIRLGQRGASGARATATWETYSSACRLRKAAEKPARRSPTP